MADQIVNYVRLAWAGGENKFHLRFDGGPKSNDGLGMGPGIELHDRVRAILGRLLSGTWGVDDISKPILLGLIGGEDFPRGRITSGVSWPRAHDLVEKHVLTRPLAESLPLAQCILIAAIMGVPADMANRVRSVDDYQAEVEVDG